MNDLYESNLLYLKEHQENVYKQLVNYIENGEDDKGFTLIHEPVLNIQYTMNGETHLLYSKYNPSYECERWADTLVEPEGINTDIFMYGLGLTYHLAALIEKYPNRKIFIFEPEVAVFNEALKIIEIDKVFNHPNVVFIVVGYSGENLNIFSNLTYYFAKFPIQLVEMPVFRTIDSEKFLAFLKVVERTSIHKLFKRGFHMNFGEIMYTNSLKNMKIMKTTPTLDLFKNKFKGSTAFVIGGGPSLKEDIEYIKQVKDDVFIVAAGSSVQSLVHLGVSPHLIVSMDPGVNNYNVFAGGRYNDYPLLFMPQIHHQIPAEHSHLKMFAYYNSDEMTNYLLDMQKKDCVFDPSYSVTGTAIQVAIYCGATRVVFTGQDLSYPDNERYSPGATHLASLKNGNKYASNKLTEEVPNVLGGTNPTTFSMKKTLENIEEIVKQFKEIEFYNASSRGAVIEGADFTKMEDVVSNKIGLKYNFNEIKERLSQPIGDYVNEEFIPLNENGKKLLLDIDLIYKKLKTIKSKINMLVKTSSKDFYKAEQILRDIEDKWKDILDNYVFNEFLLAWVVLEMDSYDKAILDIEYETDINKKARLIDKALGGLIISIQKSIKVIKEHIEPLIDNK